jgi:hypothetical protein
MFLRISNASPDDERKIEKNNNPIDNADGKVRH